MSIAQQLYHLQTLDQEIEAGQQSLQELIRNLGESQAIIDLRASLASEKQHLEALQKQQHSLEWEAGDITTKLKAAEEELYSGRIHNPKELSNLQRDIELLKANRSRIEDKILELMEQSDSHNKGLTGLQEKYARVEAEWRLQQQQLLLFLR